MITCAYKMVTEGTETICINPDSPDYLADCNKAECEYSLEEHG